MSRNRGTRVTNLFTIPPQVIINIFEKAGQNNGQLESDDIDTIKKFHAVLLQLDEEKQRQYFTHALLVYNKYVTSAYSAVYEDLMKDLIASTSFPETVLNEIIKVTNTVGMQNRTMQEAKAIEGFHKARTAPASSAS